MQRIAEDPRVGATTLLPQPYPPDGAGRFVAYAQEVWGDEFHLAIEDDGGAVLGVLALKEMDILSFQADLGYYVDPARWGEGIATRAVALACTLARDEGLLRLTAHTLVSNPASGRVLEKNGFELIETIPNPFARWPRSARVARYALYLKGTRTEPGPVGAPS